MWRVLSTVHLVYNYMKVSKHQRKMTNELSLMSLKLDLMPAARKTERTPLGAVHKLCRLGRWGGVGVAPKTIYYIDPT